MKHKLLRKITVILSTLAICTCLIGQSQVFASDILKDSLAMETDADYAEDTSYSLLRGNNLNFGTTQITKLSSTKINVSGLTQCHRVCDTVYLSMYLEQKSNGSYSTYKSWNFTADNVSNLSKSINVIVPSGHYYRVRGYHAAKDGAKESTETLTSGVLVN
ncbi:MAG: DUF6147 family protein [Eubacteriales bacterium]|nr:DUF6147 family protein [Eubacteriales bacterium]